jgi:tRNA dimethylallyltransferase
MNHLKRILFIAGPTAVGKSQVALSLAQQLRGEIVSCDSMQIYRELQIASNKPSEEERNMIEHHLLDVVSIHEPFDVARYYQMATEAVAGIHSRHHLPIVAGGSGLYMQVLLDGIFEDLSKDPELRRRLAAQEEAVPGTLWKQLEKLDPESAERIHINDRRRTIRALEVCLQEGRPFSEMRTQRKGLWGEYQVELFCLNRDRQQLYDNINKRTEEMFKQGLVEEIKSLNRGQINMTAQGAIGIKEVLAYLDGEYDLQYAVSAIQKNTRHFAKRQLTWFRKEKRLKWIDIGPSEPVENIVQRMIKEIT